MKTRNNQLVFFLRVLISALFLLSAFAKLYPTPMFGITKVFEQGQLIPMGFSESLAPYLSRFIIGAEIFLAITIVFNNYLKKQILPLAFIMISVFTIHLSTQLFGNSENCGCFGDLIPMTPFEAIIKNIFTLVILAFIYWKSEDVKGKLSELVILFLLISTVMFASLPISSQSKSVGNSFISHVEDEEFLNLEERKILCFFDPDCGHCQQAARSFDSLSNIIEDFPQSYIIFQNMYGDTTVSEQMKVNINRFFDLAGSSFPYQVMPYSNDTEEIDSYFEITYPLYDNPLVILYDGKIDYDVIRNIQIRLYEGGSNNGFDADDLRRILENKR